jgi:putative ABC transport system permease protein
VGVASRIITGFRNLLKKQKLEKQLDDEVRAFVEMLTDEKVALGVHPDEARRRAIIEAGGVEQVKQSVREQRAGTGAEILWQDVRYGLRGLRHSPTFAMTAVVTLGLGIGATTSIFSVAYSLLLRPLPYPNSSQIMSISSSVPSPDSGVIISPEFVAAQQGLTSFEQVAGYHSANINLSGTGDPVRVSWVAVTSNFFPMIGVPPQLGRSFTSSEDQLGGPPVILVSNRLWRSQFHADPAVVGKVAVVDGRDQTIIGVLPPGFTFPDLDLEPDIYAPANLNHDTSVTIETAVIFIHAIGRLRPGVTRQQAQAEVRALFQARLRTYPVPIGNVFAERRMLVEPLQRHLTGDDRKPLYILLASVAAVLLIVCMNIANLQLARTVSRRHETALRGALGASRLRLVRQFLVESLLLSSLAVTVGLAIAFVVTSLIRHAGMSAGVQPRTTPLFSLPFGKLSTVVHVDGWVLTFAVVLALLTTVLFGLAPAIHGSRTDLRNALQTAALRITSGREQTLVRNGLLIVEVGLAVVLLTSAGLLVRSFLNVMQYDSGFDPSNTLTGVTLLGALRYQSVTASRNFAENLLPKLQALPGVESAALASSLPLGHVEGDAFALEDSPNPPLGARKVVGRISITPDYFRTVGTPLIRGRAFDVHDTSASAHVVIVNRAFAKEFFAGDALGKRFTIGQSVNDKFGFLPSTIVGIADDVRRNGLEQEVQPEFYVPMSQVPSNNINIAVRSRTEPASLANAMRNAITSVDQRQALFGVETMEDRVSDVIARRRLIMLLITCFAMFAVLLSAVGIYGVFAYSVSQRKQEMGIRLALGASRGDLFRLVVMHAAGLIAIGGMIGTAASLILGRLLASMLVGVTAHDPATVSFACVLMALIALLASTLPAGEAARTDLISILHSE